MRERPGLVTFRGTPATLVGEVPEIGAPAPRFTALRADLSTFSLADVGDRAVVINSVPSLDTPVCQTQTRRFNQEAAALGPGVKVLVVSTDLPFAMHRFCATEGIADLETLSDHLECSFGLAYGLLMREFRLLARSVLVIDRSGILRYRELVPKSGQEPDYERALAEARACA